MRLFLLTFVTMIAFAGNSVLNRAALKGGEIDAMGFAVIRLGAGALMLLALVVATGRLKSLAGSFRPAGAAALLVYMLGFSAAYLWLDAGVGALILFGGVQVTMFVGALWGREAVPPRRWAGAGLALVGLMWLLWPGGGTALSGLHAGMMVLAAIGWGIYSLIGRRAGDPLTVTAANFTLALPVAALAAMLLPGGASATTWGVALAVISGAVTSGLGYALWYHILPQLGAARAAVAQLTVPVIAVLGGTVLLGEVPSGRLAGSAALVLAGVALAAWQRRAGPDQPTMRSSGS